MSLAILVGYWGTCGESSKKQLTDDQDRYTFRSCGIRTEA